MRATLAATGALLLSVATPAFAHRVDEYLQATTIAVERDRVQAQIRLTPGIEVFPEVLAFIDADHDGVVSDVEQRRYAARVLRDLSLTIDGERVALRLVSFQFADLEVLRDGRGVIAIDFTGDVPRGAGGRRLVFENHHLRRIGEYLVNGLVPRDPDIRLGAQHRSYDQSVYRLDYAQAGAAVGPLSAERWPGVVGWVAFVVALMPVAWLVAWRGRAPRRRAIDA